MGIWAVWMALSLNAVIAEPAGFGLWSRSALDSVGLALATRLDERKLATEQLGKYGNHSFMILRREASGEAEVHENQVDVFIVQGGSAALVVGGKVEGGRTTAPGETRGTSVSGGERKTLGPGDIVHIPAALPHQLLLKPGECFTYVIVKIDAK